MDVRVIFVRPCTPSRPSRLGCTACGQEDVLACWQFGIQRDRNARPAIKIVCQDCSERLWKANTNVTR